MMPLVRRVHSVKDGETQKRGWIPVLWEGEVEKFMEFSMQPDSVKNFEETFHIWIRM